MLMGDGPPRPPDRRPTVAVRIHDPVLRVEPVTGHAGRRRLVVEYDLENGRASGPSAAGDLVETVVVRARDVHDAPVRPVQFEMELAPSRSLDPEAAVQRRFEREVDRVDLDVEGDWWRTGQGGEIEPLSEFVDHLVGVVTVRAEGEIVAEVETQLVAGSWGALGSD